MKIMRVVILLGMLGMMLAGCSQQSDPTRPDTGANTNEPKDGTETLGVPSITIATGSGFAEGGVGMVGMDTAVMTVEVPADVEIKQVLLYWMGGTTAATGDDEISLDDEMIQGELIGGPTLFFEDYAFSAYRADITEMNLVTTGANSFTVGDFEFTSEPLDENAGASLLVIYDDGTEAEIVLRDGLDLAFYQFSPTLDATAPQTFPVTPATIDRVAELVLFAGSVGQDRPNQVRVTTSAGVQVIENAMGSTDGAGWDSLLMPVDVPAGDSEVTVQLVSTANEDPLGASLGWVGAGLAVPPEPQDPMASIGDFVWIDENQNGMQDLEEVGLAGVVVHLLDCEGNELDETETDMDGGYLFDGLTAGDYSLQFVLPDGYLFAVMDQGMDDELDSDADPMTGATTCITLDADEEDNSWDAGVYLMPDEGCTYTIGFWKNHAGFGPQDDVVTPLLPQYLGDEGGTKTLHVGDAAAAVAIFKKKDFGGSSNGIAKLYAQMLAAKLNVANGASDAAVADLLADADAFLADYRPYGLG